MIVSDYSVTDDIIFENGKITLYEKSKTYRIEKNIESIEERSERLEDENQRLKESLDQRIKEDW